MAEKTLQEQLAEMKTNLEAFLTEKNKAEVDALKAQITVIEGNLAKNPTTEQIDALKAEIKTLNDAALKNQPIIDAFVKGERKNDRKPVSFANAFTKAIEDNSDAIKKLEKEKGRITFEIKDFDVKTVGDMTLGANLSGDQVASYVGQGILPPDTINLRDLIPTRQTQTGLAVTYREGIGEGAVARQTEGSAKAQVDTDWTEVKVVQRYISAFQRVSKQMLQDLPFMSTTMPRILMRKYMKKENLLLYADLSTSTYSTANSPSGSDTPQKILDMIKTQRSNGYSASIVLITWTDWYNILTATRPGGGLEYSLPGGVVVTPNGDVIMAGVRITPASWVTASDIQIIDTAYIERLEVDSLKVELSTEDADNFTKNLVTMRVECRTDLNSLLPSAHLNYGTAS